MYRCSIGEVVYRLMEKEDVKERVRAVTIVPMLSTSEIYIVDLPSLILIFVIHCIHNNYFIDLF